jgi:hypothetical protein
LFHQGFAWLNYLLNVNVIHGLVITCIEEKISITHWSDTVDSTLQKQTYISTVMAAIVQHLDTLIQLDNVHQWDSLLSLYKWKQSQIKSEICRPISKEFYTSFCLEGNEYYLLEYDTFKVYPTDRKTYLNLKLVI